MHCEINRTEEHGRGDSQRGTVTKGFSLAKDKVQAERYAARLLTKMAQKKFQAWNQTTKESWSFMGENSGINLTFVSGPVEGTGVVARVAGTDPCRFERVVWNVPYLLDSPFKPEATASPVVECATDGGSKNVDAVASGDSSSSPLRTEL